MVPENGSPFPFPRERLEEIVRADIERKEDLGTSAGGSGHLADKGAELGYIAPPVVLDTGAGEAWRIKYTYKVQVVTEFTQYPDNPPHEYERRGQVLVDAEGNLLEVGT
ncbi:MAG: hypothetical protein ACTSU5_11250 [Promethearchaeota archaeon]